MIINIQDKLRASNVTRWHTVPLVKSQSMAEHSYNVAVMAYDLGRIMKFSDKDIKRMMVKALHHDLHEIIDGDAPSPVKRKKPKDWSGVWMWIDVVEFCDILESYQFIDRYAIERHGYEAARMYKRRVEDILIQCPYLEVIEFKNHVMYGKYKYEWREEVLEGDPAPNKEDVTL